MPLEKPPSKIKTDKIYEKTVFKIVDIRQQKTTTSEKQETNKAAPIIAPVYCLEKVSRPQNKEEDPKGNLVDSLSLGVRADSSVGARQ